MDVGAAFVTDQQTTEAMEPSERALNHPAHLAQAVFSLASSWNHRANAPASACRATSLEVIGFVGIQTLGSFSRASTRNSHRRHGIQKWLQHATVVDIGSGQQDRQRQTLVVGQQMVFGARTAAVGRVGSGK